jgi:toxin ParE1/3/4
MAVYSLTTQADADLEGIYEYTIFNFGLAQARNYLDGLRARFDMLAEHPYMAVPMKHSRQGCVAPSMSRTSCSTCRKTTAF